MMIYAVTGNTRRAHGKSFTASRLGKPFTKFGFNAEWRSGLSRLAHDQKIIGSNPICRNQLQMMSGAVLG
jgi:hypothetical protein